MIVTRETIKNWFRTYLKPTQSQFWDTWDSFVHKNDVIPQTNIEGLLDDLAGLPTSEQLDLVDDLAPKVVNVVGAGTYSLNPGKILEYVVAEATSDGSILIGTSVGGSQLIGDTTLKANEPELFVFNSYFKTATTVHFSGTFLAKIYIR